MVSLDFYTRRRFHQMVNVLSINNLSIECQLDPVSLCEKQILSFSIPVFDVFIVLHLSNSHNKTGFKNDKMCFS